MAKVDWSAGIDSVSGALSKPSKSGQHSCTKMLLGTHRVAPTTSNQCNRLFLRKKTKRSTTPSGNELWARTRFTEVSQAVALRKKDLNSVNADNQAFLAQKDQPGGKKTMFSYLWSICAANYDTAHPRS